MAKMQVMVLGCNGQLGHELVRQLGEEAVPKPREVLDITNLKAVRELLPHVRPNLVINCTGITSPTQCDRNRGKAYRVNVEAVDNLLKTCAITGIPLMQISCDQVFGADSARRTPYTETDCVGPVNYYGTTKVAAEHSVMRLGQCMCPEYWKAGFRYWVIRTSMLYERPWRQSQNWVYGMLQFAQNRRDGILELSGDVYRSPTYAPHLAKALIWIARHHREVVSGIYHIANAGAPSLYEVGTAVSSASRVGLNLGLTDKESYCRRHGRDASSVPEYTALNCDKFNEISPVVLPDWRDALDEFAMEWDGVEE